MNKQISQDGISEAEDGHLHFPIEQDESVSELINILTAQKAEIQQQNQALFSTLSKLEKSLSTYQELFELSPIGFFILDSKGYIEKANARAGVHLRSAPYLLAGRDFNQFFTDQPAKSKFQRHLDAARDSLKITPFECQIRREDGTTFAALIKSTVLKDDAGTFKHTLTILTDISEIKSHEQQIEESLAKTQAINEMFSSFLSIASHEFRTPLSAVLSSNSLVEKYAELGQKDMMQKHLARIKSSVKVMVNIIEDFLSLEKLESGHLEIMHSTFNLTSVCQDLVEEIRPQTKAGQFISYSSVGTHQVRSDKKALQHILSNLLSNACKYSEANKQILFTTDINSERILTKIQDYGIGIPNLQQEKIFTRFFRAANTVSINGTGLGLYICKRYVELLNGTISFTSEIGKGTTFTVEIPQSSGALTDNSYAHRL